MRKTKKLYPISSVTILMILMIGCEKPIKTYTKSDNLIEIDAVRQKSCINDLHPYIGMATKKGLFWDKVYPNIEGIPDSLNDVKLYFAWIDNIQALYQAYKTGVVDRKDFLDYYHAWGSDTTECSPDYVKTFVIVATGIGRNGQQYYFFDSNNDLNLSDEIPYETTRSTYFFKNPNFEYQPHKIIYEKYIDKSIQKDSTWIAFFEYNDMMMIQFCEHTSASFRFDSLDYSILTYPSETGYRDNPTFSISKGFNKKSKVYYKGEYIKLGDSYYQISCRMDGLKIYLTKDADALSKGSTQIGMPPPKFKAKTLSGDSINFPSGLKGKYILLDFWSINCAPCIQEIKEYYIDIYKRYGGTEFEIVGIADNLPDDLAKFIRSNNIKWIIIPDGEQKSIQKIYRINHYPTLYLISPEGNIIAKENELRAGQFVSFLDKHFNKNQK